MIETSIAFSKWLVTRTTRVSAVAYIIVGTCQLSYFSMVDCVDRFSNENCVVVLFFSA